MIEAMRRAAEVPELPAATAARMQGFLELVDRYAAAFGREPVGAVARRLVDEVDLWAHARSGVKSADAGQRKVDALESMLRSVEGWTARTSKKPTLRNYLAKLALDTREEEPEGGDGVTLMSLHAAKGLEFPVVFLIGVEEDLLPCAGIQGAARDLEEERRLAYVGITRARERLVITRAQARLKRGKLLPRTPSRFLQDLPPESFVLFDPAKDRGSPEAVAARSAEVMAALRARFGGSSSCP